MHLLVTGAWQGFEINRPILEGMGHEIKFMQWEKDELPCSPEWVEGIIGNGIFLSHPIEDFKSLRYIQLTSAGYDRVPMDYVQTNNIEIHNARGVYSIPMAEYAVTGVLYLYKQMAFFHDNQKKHLWMKCRSLQELTAKKVVIVGCGSVGTECAKRFAVFGCEVIAVNRTVREDANYQRIVGLDDLNKELAEADVLILTVPLTRETTHMIGVEELSTMKKTAILVNISRGPVVDQNALVAALKAREIGGAVLDVFEEEPLSEDSILWEMENVVLTPHNSFVGEKNQNRLADIILNNLRKFE